MARKRRFATDAELNEYRSYVWNHNATYGRVGNALKLVDSIAGQSMSASPRAKRLAKRAAVLLDLLEEELYNYRVEPDGTLVAVKRPHRHKGFKGRK